ncbi:GTP-binding protein [Morus notabilis]|uniref:GTP-binding protein n=1 Tax=Morus notabilis TaxID=981085 RepID=W9QPH6_9ROSA|nr:GTP-binding protein [Morus notabilis]
MSFFATRESSSTSSRVVFDPVSTRNETRRLRGPKPTYIAPLIDSAYHRVLLGRAQDVGNGGQLRVDVVNHVPKVMECDGPHCSVDAVVYLVDAFDKERFAESKKELDALLSDEVLANVPFLILGNKIDIPYAASEDELRYSLGLTNFTTGKGKVNLADSNVRPLEVFMCSIVRKMGYGDGFKWLSQYIK